MIKAIIFDWDGTLYNTIPFMIRTYQEVMRECRLRVWSEEDFRSRFRNDWVSMLPEMGLLEHKDFLLSRWEENKQKRKDRLCLYPGVKETLEELNPAYQLAIVSSAPQKSLLEEIGRLGVANYFSAVVAMEDTANTKPNPEPLLLAAGKLSVLPQECLYVGDMVCDIQAGKKAGMKVIGVSWGLHSQERLKQAGAEKVVEKLKELEPAIEEIFRSF